MMTSILNNKNLLIAGGILTLVLVFVLWSCYKSYTKLLTMNKSMLQRSLGMENRIKVLEKNSGDNKLAIKNIYDSTQSLQSLQSLQSVGSRSEDEEEVFDDDDDDDLDQEISEDLQDLD
jgi:hypothetical protein